MSTKLNKDGCVPVGRACPFSEKCGFSDTCPVGTSPHPHNRPFSCAMARGFDQTITASPEQILREVFSQSDETEFIYTVKLAASLALEYMEKLGIHETYNLTYEHLKMLDQIQYLDY